jgi:nitroimidazol reductase NimA-like FMN-containing flavoprotein (pyridoxamine 5'-phosphate oxidase superfamily)
MTDHDEIKMYHEDRRITDPKILQKILDLNRSCCVALHDEPYPYIVPMNYGYIWNDKLIFYLHMAKDGHRVSLIKKNPHVSLNVFLFLDRAGHARYRGESHDYRSVTAYGIAEIVSPYDDEKEFLSGLSILCAHTGRPEIKKITGSMYEKLLVLKIPVGIVTGKAQYPIKSPDEVPIPENFD